MGDLEARFLAWLRVRLDAEPELARFFDGSYEVRTGDERWTFNVRPRVIVREGAHPAETAIRISAEDLIEIVNGERSSADAVAERRLQWFGQRPDVQLTLAMLRRAEARVETVAEYLERRLPEVARGRGFFDVLPNGLRIELTGAGTWTVGARCAIEEGGGEPFAAEIDASREDLEALLAGTLEAEAVEQGRIAMTGERSDGPFLAFQSRAPRGAVEGTIEPADVLVAVVPIDESGPMGPVLASAWFRLTLPPGEWSLNVEAAGLQIEAPAKVVVEDGATSRVAMRLTGR